MLHQLTVFEPAGRVWFLGRIRIDDKASEIRRRLVQAYQDENRSADVDRLIEEVRQSESSAKFFYLSPILQSLGRNAEALRISRLAEYDLLLNAPLDAIQRRNFEAADSMITSSLYFTRQYDEVVERANLRKANGQALRETEYSSMAVIASGMLQGTSQPGDQVIAILREGLIEHPESASLKIDLIRYLDDCG